ncbi:MAG TPA: vWA domain-containing protein [Pirellulaceae bacterium]|jgi:hypothetical protein|nr:vWA domain-containing protein [Pirellulaceae bacterium]
MNPIRGLRQWWQRTTGEEETPFDGDAPTWIVSMLFHMALLLGLAAIPSELVEPEPELMIVSQPIEEEEQLIEIPDFAFDPFERELIGANGDELANTVAESLAPMLDETFVEPTVDLAITTLEPLSEVNVRVEKAAAHSYSDTVVVKGDAGSTATAAAGAIDRITHEIMLSLDQRKTHVVWLFDQTASLETAREVFVERLEKIYEELGVIEAAGAEQFAKHDTSPLTTSVIGFGNTVNLYTPEPTDNLSEIVAAVRNMPKDGTGVERVFGALYEAANKFKHYRLQDGGRDPKRNVMLIVLTDEAGSDAATGLEETVKVCRRYSMPVYVIGVPAPFGRKETYVKYVDPDPAYDQSPQFLPIDQGPESMEPEGIRLSFGARRGEEEPIVDSGFGPFALTRLCYETGGIYFTVHPNRNVNRAVSRRETDEFAAHLEHFFDPNVMRKYRPDYVSRDEYMRRVQSSQMRSALIQAARLTWLESIEQPTLTFVKRDEADFVVALTNAQRESAKFSPKIDQLYQLLRMGEADREKETSPRWQAGFDLAYGRVLAAKVRTETMNAMLAEAKRGLKPKDPKSNTWTLTPSDEVTVDSQLAAAAEKAKTLLTRVAKDHDGTPWALMAEKDLALPLGWTWEESYTAPPAPMRQGPANPNPVVNPAPNRPAEQRNMIEKPTPRRAPPKL